MADITEGQVGSCDLDDAHFESHVNERSKAKAKKELNEKNDKDRLLAVETLRTWMKQQPWLKAPIGTELLVRQLRVRKYSQLKARESLENYWTTRTKHPTWFQNIDPCDPLLVDILSSGSYIVSKKLDSEGCRVVVLRFGFMDVEKVKKVWKTDNVLKALFTMYEWITSDENVQVNGVKIFADYTNVTMAHVMMFSDQHGPMMSYFQKALPLRMKGMYLYNEPTFFDVIHAMYSRFMSDKLKNRMHLMGKNMAKVYEKIDKTVLPDEYLPDDYEGESAGPMSKIIDDMMADMQTPKFRAYMKKISTPGVYGVDLDMRKKDGKNSVPEGSFRKLNID